MGSHVNWNLFSKYISWLEKNRFIIKDSETIEYSLTLEGKVMFERLEKLVESMKIQTAV